ncbi:hypothetical protein K523DRAFT_320415 [Schizophyllum commune Tattone D]|nr:hypothetical protein K523DRAFT_320415 [Schizophyllum commune Tattone D]
MLPSRGATLLAEPITHASPELHELRPLHSPSHLRHMSRIPQSLVLAPPPCRVVQGAFVASPHHYRRSSSTPLPSFQVLPRRGHRPTHPVPRT